MKIMARQKPNQQEVSNEERLTQELKTRNEQLLELHALLDENHAERRHILQSRNIALIVIVVLAVAVYYLVFIKVPDDDLLWQKNQVARKLHAIQDAKQQEAEKRQAAEQASKKYQGLTLDTSISKSNLMKTETNSIRFHANDPGWLPWREKKAITTMLHLWAVAREIKDLPRYFANYSESFDTQSRDMDYQQWKASRSYQINRQRSASISLDDINIQHLTEDFATVTFNQQLQEGEKATETHLLLDLVHERGKWLILREHRSATTVDL